MLEERLFDPRFSVAEFAAACRAAADARVAAVVCQPSRVALASHLLLGTSTKVAVTASREFMVTESAALGRLAAQAEKLVQDGAQEIGILAPVGPLSASLRGSWAQGVRALTDLASAHHAIVRVVVTAAGLTAMELESTCGVAAEAGAGLIQCGTWLKADRASFSQITTIREAIGDAVLLKWGAPVNSLDRLLLACGEGVDRFTADSTAILREASKRAMASEIRVPEPGHDY
jgi:deoxyribose-phosphate aldolase